MQRLTRRTLSTLLLSCAGVVVALSCNTPTLPPLPPPAEPRVVQHMGDGEVLLEGTLPVEGAKLLVLNLETNEIRGVFLPNANRYSLPISAEPGDFIHLWYSLAGTDSPLARFEIPPRPEPGVVDAAADDPTGDAAGEDAAGATDAAEPAGD